MYLEKLLETPKKKALQIITLTALVAFLLMTILGGVVNKAPVYTILDYEFALTLDSVVLIFNAWGAAGKQQIALGIYMDFLYIVAYVALIFGCLLIAARNLEGKFQTVGLCMVITPIIAGICDIVENVNLLLMIVDTTNVTPLNPLIAALCATVKFSIIIACILFFLVEIIVIAINRKK